MTEKLAYLSTWNEIIIFVLKETEFAKNDLFRAANTWRQRRHPNTKLEAIHSKKYVSWQTMINLWVKWSKEPQRKFLLKEFFKWEAVPFYLSNRQLSERCVSYMIPSSIAFLDCYINQGIPYKQPKPIREPSLSTRLDVFGRYDEIRL